MYGERLRMVREMHDAHSELVRWFGFDDFRAEPAMRDGGSMQRAIVEKAMAGEHVLGLLPTGSGKSLCYQVPALSRYHKTGALTVVISHIDDLLRHHLPADTDGGAIVYCSTRRRCEEVAEYLAAKTWSAANFHAGLQPERKKQVQEDFIDGPLSVIVATNAFGMGVDKPDVRLVVHADIPGSLENYLQEAGRAGRDAEAASCVLLYTADDVERQFGLAARSRLTRPEIDGICRALRNLRTKAGTTVEVARARTGPKDRRRRGQRSLQYRNTETSGLRRKQLILEAYVVRTSDVVRNAG